jgi:hypothetical protein
VLDVSLFVIGNIIFCWSVCGFYCLDFLFFLNYLIISGSLWKLSWQREKQNQLILSVRILVLLDYLPVAGIKKRLLKVGKLKKLGCLWLVWVCLNCFVILDWVLVVLCQLCLLCSFNVENPIIYAS